MSARTYTIGELARRSGLPVRKIRFYADAGLLSPDRTDAQYRLFHDRDLVVLDLIRTLRDAGASLAAIRSVLEKDATLGELLTVRLADIEASIRRQKALAATLRLALATGTPTIRDFQWISQMIGHSQTQRHATATAFLDTLTKGVQFDPRWRDTMVNLIAAPTLPDEPSVEQIDAWLEVNELLANKRLWHVLRTQAIDTGRTLGYLRVRDELEAWRARENEILDQARSALRREVSAASAEGQELADAFIGFMAWNRGLSDDEAFRSYIRDMVMENSLLERFWHRVEKLHGRERLRSAEYEWLVRAAAIRLQCAQ